MVMPINLARAKSVRKELELANLSGNDMAILQAKADWAAYLRDTPDFLLFVEKVRAIQAAEAKLP